MAHAHEGQFGEGKEQVGRLAACLHVLGLLCGLVALASCATKAPPADVTQGESIAWDKAGRTVPVTENEKEKGPKPIPWQPPSPKPGAMMAQDIVDKGRLEAFS